MLDHLTDLQILALTLYGEARGESTAGRHAVAWVIKNRAARRFRGATIRDVCLSPKQFSCWNPTDANRALLEDPRTLLSETYKRIEREARAVVQDEVEDPTGGADHYHERSIAPYWASSMTETARIGHHVFYRMKPLAKSRTVKTAQVAGAGGVVTTVTGITATVAPAVPFMREVADFIREYPTELMVLVGVILLGTAGYVAWARLSDRARGLR